MCLLLACHIFAGSGPTAPSWEWGWDFQHASPHRGSTKQAAPTKLRQALNRGVLRGSGGTQQQLVMVMYLNEYRTTLAQSASVKKNTACVPDAET